MIDARDAARARIKELEHLAHIAGQCAMMDHRFLYDRARRLLSIGYSVDEQRLDAGILFAMETLQEEGHTALREAHDSGIAHLDRGHHGSVIRRVLDTNAPCLAFRRVAERIQVTADVHECSKGDDYDSSRSPEARRPAHGAGCRRSHR